MLPGQVLGYGTGVGLGLPGWFQPQPALSEGGWGGGPEVKPEVVVLKATVQHVLFDGPVGFALEYPVVQLGVAGPQVGSFFVNPNDGGFEHLAADGVSWLALGCVDSVEGYHVPLSELDEHLLVVAPVQDQFVLFRIVVSEGEPVEEFEAFDFLLPFVKPETG